MEERIGFLDKAVTFANTQNRDSLERKIFSYKSKLFSDAGQLDSSIVYSKKLLQVSEKLADSVSIGKAYYKLGLYHNKKNSSDSAYYYYNLSKKIFISLNDSVAVGKRLLNMAIIQSNWGDYLNSDNTAVEALNFLENSKASKTIASVQNCLAISAKKRKDYDESLYWYKQALETTKNKINSLKYSNNIANVYLEQGDFKKAISMYTTILNDSLTQTDLKTKARVLDNLAYARWLMTGSENELVHFMEALNMKTQQNDLYGQIASNAHLSTYFEKINRVKSKRYAEKMYEISIGLNSIDDRLEALKKLLKLEDSPKKLKQYAERYIHLNDSIIESRESHKNRFAKLRYDTEKNRIENFNLKIKNAKNQLNLEKSNRQKTIYLVSGIFLLLSSFFLYTLIKAKHKKEKIEQIYNTEKRISKRVHDEVANDVYHAMIKLQGETNNESEVLDDLECIYKKTRDISKENSAIDLDGNFKDALNELLLNYNKDDITLITKGLSKVHWESISDTKKTIIYRVLQELMVNMKKHSKASITALTFEESKNRVCIEYKDNGVGCTIHKGAGLQNVENRIQSVNGIVTFESQVNKGFKVNIIV
ncbi:tetratricopeptide repeat protein [Flavobacteriaceae bacterium F08102]|nr:tetratricopeptide repeat protein [Flavobacteriaceae bacterium F08102]